MFPAAANKTTIQKMNAARHLQVLMTYPNEKIAQQVRFAYQPVSKSEPT
jgi:hypothetical protein